MDRCIQVADRSILKAFEEVGLDTSVPQYIEWAPTYMDTIGACFMYLYQNFKQYTFADDGNSARIMYCGGIVHLLTKNNLQHPKLP